MRPSQLPNFNGLALGSRATAQIPNYPNSLAKIDLQILAGGLTKANITELVLKVGSKTFFGPISAADLDKVMAYRGHVTDATFVAIDLTERDALTRGMKEIGAVDLRSLGGQGVYLEVLNNLGAGTPSLNGLIGFSSPQFVDKNGDGRNDRQGQLMHKLLRYSLPNTGTRFVWQPVFGGAQIKRVHFFYTGTDWTTTADGNLKSVDVKIGGRSVFERPSCLANRFMQRVNSKVPQSRVYTVDFVFDDVMESMLDTRGARSLEFVLELTASDNVTAYAEFLDIPNNL